MKFGLDALADFLVLKKLEVVYELFDMPLAENDDKPVQWWSLNPADL